MKKYNKEDFAKFKVVDGFIKCPSGDYTAITVFPERCYFGERCRFGKRCSFGVDCSFGEWCSFGEGCRFGDSCNFGKRCSFGDGCNFGKRCSFGVDCSFGKRCSFGVDCSFENLEFTALEQVYFIRVNNIGSRQDGCYIFNAINGLYVRCGGFFGKEETFIEAVQAKHAGTKHARTYALAIELAKAQFELKGE